MTRETIMPLFAQAFRSSRLHACALTACVALWSQPAAAVFASFGYPPMAAEGSGDTVITGNHIELPNTTTPNFYMNVVLPRDYTNNTAVRIIFYFSPGSFTPCQVRFVPFNLRRKRVGAVTDLDPEGLSSTSTQVVFDGSGVVVQKVFTLVEGGELPGQIRGDAFTMQFGRQALNASDTCTASAYIEAIEIRYEKVP
jgi:hypothetical protein